MNKRNKIITILLLTTTLLFSLTSCESETVQVNVSNGENVSSNQFGQFIYIGGDLVYDLATRIVYIASKTYYDYVYTPYYAPNGLPYRYNPETNTFEEINIKDTERN